MDDGSPKGSGSLLRRPSSNQLPKEISQTKSVRKLMAPPQALRESAGPFPPALLRPEDSNPLEQHAPSVAFLDLSVGGGAPSLAVALERLRVVVTRGAKVEAVSFAGQAFTEATLTEALDCLKVGNRQRLDLSYCHLDDTFVPVLAAFLRTCSDLPRELLIAGNRFTNVAPLLCIPTLRLIDVSGNPQRDWQALASALPCVFGLTRLHISYTGLDNASLASLLGSLSTKVQSFVASGNPITEIPETIGQFTSLTMLDFSRCQLEWLPNALLSLRSDTVIDVKDNLWLMIPPKPVCLSGMAGIQDHLRNSRGTLIDGQLRVILLGHGQNGKTTLHRALHRSTSGKDRRRSSTASAAASAAANTIKRPSVSELEAFSGPKLSIGSASAATILDFPGNIEDASTVYTPFLAYHNSLYVVVVSLTASLHADALRAQIAHWLGVISDAAAKSAPVHPYSSAVASAGHSPPASASNSPVRRRTPSPAQRPAGSGLRGSIGAAPTPQFPVTVVFTKSHLVPPASLQRIIDDLHSWAIEMFPRLAIKQFIACDSANGNDISKLLKHLGSIGDEILIPDVCSRVLPLAETALAYLPSLASVSPIWHLNAVKEALCRLDASFVGYGPRLWHSALQSLHNRTSVLIHWPSETVCLCPRALLSALALLAPRHREWPESLSSSPSAIATISDLKEAIDEEEELRVGNRSDALVAFLEAMEFIYKLPQKGLSSAAYFVPCARAHAEVVQQIRPAFVNDVFYVGSRVTLSEPSALRNLYERLQIALLPLLDSKFRVFTNVMFVTQEDASGHVRLDTDGKHVDFVVEARLDAQPRAFLDTLLSYIPAPFTAQCKLMPLCGHCLPGCGVYSIVEGGACSHGHKLTDKAVHEGVKADTEARPLAEQWTPQYSSEFYSCPEWKTTEEELRYITLTENDKDRARQREYIRARDMFYKFLQADQDEGLVLERVTFLDNPRLERAFFNYYTTIMKRFQSVDRPDVPKAATYSDEPQEAIDYRKWMMANFERSRELISGSGLVNLVPGWHGTSERAMMKIAKTNFLPPSELAKTDTLVSDPGYFGKGIYFTQYPSYGTKYASGTTCLLFSWLIMGRVFPVIEHPMKPNNLVGKPCMPGFDSHYVVVKSEELNKIYFPCPSSAAPDCDELVVFRPAQILPRYIFYYKRLPKESPNASTTISAPRPFESVDRPDGPPPSRFVVWVDDKILPPMVSILKQLEKQNPELKVVHAISTSELSVWLSRNEKVVRSDSVRVVTNRFRTRDGGDNAARALVSMLRRDALTSSLKVLVFCQQTDKATDLEDKKLTFVSNSGETMTSFCTWAWPENSSLRKSLYSLIGKGDKGERKEPKKDKKDKELPEKEKDREELSPRASPSRDTDHGAQSGARV